MELKTVFSAWQNNAYEFYFRTGDSGSCGQRGWKCNIYVSGNAGIIYGLAVVTVISRCVGAGSYDQARYYTKKLLGLTYYNVAYSAKYSYFPYCCHL